MPSNCFENALVFCFIFLVKISIPLHLFDLTLKYIFFVVGDLALIAPLSFKKLFLMGTPTRTH